MKINVFYDNINIYVYIVIGQEAKMYDVFALC